MSQVFISYARSTAKQAQAAAAALRGLGHEVWLDAEIPPHRAYADVIEERLNAAKAVLVIWSAEAVKSQWVQSEADRARADGKLVQLRLDGAKLPMPFDRIQCADLSDWTGDLGAPGWRRVAASIADLVGGSAVAATAVAEAPLPLPSKPSIAVMPFANLSGDPEQDYFADGMVEEIATALSRHKSIFVIGSGSTLSLKGKAVSPQEAGRQLGVRYVLEGSVRRAVNRVRITVRLADAADGAQIWADRFEDTLEDVFALQDKVALSVAGVIEPTVRTAEIRRVMKRPTENMGSYDLYLQALTYNNTWVDSERSVALDLLDRSVALDPTFAPALARAAWIYGSMNAGAADDPDGNRMRAIALARRAVGAGGDDASVLANAANALMNARSDLDTVKTLIDRAMDLNPGSPVVWQVSGMLQLWLGEPELASQQLETAMRLDPLSALRTACRLFLGLARFQQGRFADAVTLLFEITQQSGAPLAHAYLAAAYGHLGKQPEARNALSRYAELHTTPVEGFARGRPEHRGLFLDGIALAEGGTAGGAQTSV